VDPGPLPQATSLADAARRQKPMRWLPAAWTRVLGDVPASGGSALVFGPPGSRKSTALLLLLGHAVRAGHTAILVDGEMGSGAIASLVDATGLSRTDTRKIRRQPVRAVAHVDDALRKSRASVAVVDSVSALAGEPADALRWAELVDLLLVVAHVTVEGRPRGGTGLSHDLDVVLRFGRGEVRTEKSRFGPGATVPIDELLQPPTEVHDHRVVQLHEESA